MSKNIVTLKSRSEISQGQRNRHLQLPINVP